MIDVGFRAAMAGSGITTPARIVADGRLHRVPLEGDRRGSRNGWYILYPDPPVSGAYGCWRRGITATWSAIREDRLTREDRELIRRRADEERAARMLEESRRHERAAQRAAYLWGRAVPAPADHPYLARKGVTAGTARELGGRLVLPVTDLHGRLHSLQYIDAAGGKLLLSGGRKRGNVIPVAGRMPGASRLLICEGWATGRTLAEMEPDALVLAAIDAGNLEPVSRAVRGRWPRSEIVICADADPVGISKGRAAALLADATIAIPRFPAGASGSDWNDLMVATREMAV